MSTQTRRDRNPKDVGVLEDITEEHCCRIRAQKDEARSSTTSDVDDKQNERPTYFWKRA